MKIKTSKMPWVFWFRISIRRKWFSYWWHTRGANYYELQVWIFKISIGRPWFIGAVYQNRKDYGSLNHIRQTNADNLKAPFTILMNREKKVERSVATKA